MNRITNLSPSDLLRRPDDWQVVGPPQVEAAQAWLAQRPLPQPILIDSMNQVIWGWPYVEAARNLRLNSLQVLHFDELSDDELKLYAISADRIARLGGHDEVLLGRELEEILAMIPDFDRAALAIAEAELDRLLGHTQSLDEQLGEDSFIDRGPSVSRCNDCWLIGRHRLLHGDALTGSSYVALMAGELAAFVLTDPPYNLPADAISGLGRHKHEDFLQAAGEMSPVEFTRFLTQMMRHLAAHCRKGSLIALFMGYQYLLELLRAGNIVFGRPKAICTWVKAQGGMGSLYRSRTEFITFFKNGSGRHTNNVLLGKHGRLNRTTAWEYAGMNSFSTERDELLSLHCTPKPIAMLQDAILDVTKAGDIVLDAFAGSGSLILAADASGRRGYCMELDGKYVDGSLRRIAKALSIDPVREADGRSFSDIERENTNER